MYRTRVGGLKQYAMTVKEMNRLKSNCSATSSIYMLLIVHCPPCLSPWPCAMAMPEHPHPCKHGVSNPCLKPLKHECTNHAICDIRTH